MELKKTIKTFDELTKEELYRVFKLRSEVFVVEQNCVYNDFDEKDRKAIHILIMDENSGDIVAYSRIFEINWEFASFGRVCVKKEFRKKGLGKELVAGTIDNIKKNYSQKKIFIEAQNYLQKFYESFGFKKTSDVYLEDGIPHINMILEM